MFRFEELEIWQLAIDYAKAIYQLVEKFPKVEMFALSDQIRRAVVSISNNIAEGSGGTDRDFANYLDIAAKSTLETVNCLHLAREFGYINESVERDFYGRAELLVKKIRALKRSFTRKP